MAGRARPGPEVRMKTLTITFLFLLGAAHLADGAEPLLERPLSMFRDGPQPVLGYALFAMLLAVAAVMTVASVRADRVFEVLVFGAASLLLLVVAVTPSLG